MIELQEYTSTDGRSPFADWFNDLDAPAAAKIATALIRVELGNFSNAKGVGAGVFEYRVDLWCRLQNLFWEGRRAACDFAGRWREEASTARHRGRASQMGRLQGVN
jgi:hypothetical protein